MNEFDPVELHQQEQENRDAFKKRENFKPAFISKTGKPIGPFMRGDKLHRKFSFAPAIGDEFPAGQHDLHLSVPEAIKEKIDRDMDLMTVMHRVETGMGVSEKIEYDEDEKEVRDAIGDK